MKRMICYIIFSVVLSNILLPLKYVHAYGGMENNDLMEELNFKKDPNNIEKRLVVNARAYVALDANSKIVLTEKNSDVIMPMASTTKIITALVALKYGRLDQEVEISQRAAAIHGSTVGYKKGEKITIKELLFGLMLRSGNDAAIAVAAWRNLLNS